jgi:hypothetical protein
MVIGQVRVESYYLNVRGEHAEYLQNHGLRVSSQPYRPGDPQYDFRARRGID